MSACLRNIVMLGLGSTPFAPCTGSKFVLACQGLRKTAELSAARCHSPRPSSMNAVLSLHLICWTMLTPWKDTLAVMAL
jgi:hypothetical protein